jgi:hypothetical protein
MAERPGFYDLDGQPCDLIAWCTLMAAGEQWVDYTSIVDAPDDDERAIYVSTVWLGIDLIADLDGRAPLIYETMIFGGEHDLAQWRYTNRAAAIAGHDQAVALARDAAGIRR